MSTLYKSNYKKPYKVKTPVFRLKQNKVHDDNQKTKKVPYDAIKLILV